MNNTNDPSGPISSNERTGEIQNFSRTVTGCAAADSAIATGSLQMIHSTDSLLRRDYDEGYRGMTQALAALFATSNIGDLSLDLIVATFCQSAAAKHFRKVDNIVYGGNTASYWIRTELAAAFRQYINNWPATTTTTTTTTNKENSND